MEAKFLYAIDDLVYLSHKGKEVIGRITARIQKANGSKEYDITYPNKMRKLTRVTRKESELFTNRVDLHNHLTGNHDVADS